MTVLLSKVGRYGSSETILIVSKKFKHSWDLMIGKDCFENVAVKHHAESPPNVERIHIQVWHCAIGEVRV